MDVQISLIFIDRQRKKDKYLSTKSEKVLFSSSPVNINAFLQRRDYTTPKIERKKMVIEKPQLPF